MRQLHETHHLFEPHVVLVHHLHVVLVHHNQLKLLSKSMPCMRSSTHAQEEQKGTPASPKAQQLLERMKTEEAHLEAEEKQALQRARSEVEAARQQLHEVAERKTDEANKAEQEVGCVLVKTMLPDL